MSDDPKPLTEQRSRPHFDCERRAHLGDAAHYWRWEPLDGQPAENVPFVKGRYRVTCGYGCGWTKEVTLTGEEVWRA